MKKINSLVICKQNYKTKEEFEDAIKSAIMLLLNGNYVMTVKYDEKELGIVDIEFNYGDKEFGCEYPYWLLPEEEETVVYRDDKM